MASLVEELRFELEQVPVNLLRVRGLVLKKPSIVAPNLRLKLWSTLLGVEDDNAAENSTAIPETKCEEFNVLIADIKRTRAEYEEFRTDSYQEALQAILQTFSLMHNVPYKQGLNEVLAPMLHLLPPSPTSRGSALYSIFESFVFRFLERWYLHDSSYYLFKSFRYLHLLLMYHDPILANHLQNYEFVPELYAASWFLTVFCRGVPLHHAHLLWDYFLAIDDPSFIFFIAVRLLVRKRELLLVSDAEHLPEVIASLQIFASEGNIDEVLKEANGLYRDTPRGFLRNLRLCCVSTPELTPTVSSQRERLSLVLGGSGMAHFERSDRFGLDIIDDMMTKQSVHACLSLNPREARDYLSSLDLAETSHVIIDVRSPEDIKDSGGGTIIGSITLDPRLIGVNHSEALSVWIEHLDRFKGSNILILDSIPKKETNIFRRIIFGEGDASPRPRNFLTYRGEVEVEDSDEDSSRMGAQLAIRLQSQGFPKIAVCLNGYEGVIENLLETTGSVLPYVQDFSEIRWNKFRLKFHHTRPSVANVPQGKEAESNNIEMFQHKLATLKPIDRLQLSLTVARRLGHKSTALELEQTLASLLACAVSD